MSVRTMAAVWQWSQHGGSALLMMLAIADFADDKGQAYPSVSTLAEKTRMKARNANYLLSELQASGELAIKIGAGPKGTNLYRIVLDRLTGLQPVAGVHHSAGLQPAAGVHHSAGLQPVAGVHSVAGGAALECAKPLHSSAPKPSLNHQEPSGKSASPTRRLPPCPFDEIRQRYNDSLPDEQVPWPPKRATVASKDRKKGMAARWQFVLTVPRDDGTPRASSESEALDWFSRFFAMAWHDDHLAGRSARGASHPNWRCDLDYMLTDRALTRVLEA